MSACTRCGTSLIEANGLSFCPKCADCFIPSGMIAPDVEQEETFARIRTYLNENTQDGRLLILEREHGTGCTTALHALATHQLLPHALPDFTAFYFDANRPQYRLMRDFRHFLRTAIRIYSPRYEEPDAEPSTCCARMLSDLTEQLLLRSSQKKLLLFISLPEVLPEDFLRLLPRGRSIPQRAGVFLLCLHGQAESLQSLLPRAQVLPPILRNGELHTKAIRQMLTETFCPTLRQRLSGGGRRAEQAYPLLRGDFHRAHLLCTLQTEYRLFDGQALPQADTLWHFALQYFTQEWGATRMHAALCVAVMTTLWCCPLPPMMLPALCGVSPEALADALQIPELLRVDRQEDTVVISVSCPEAAEVLHALYPQLFEWATARIAALADGSDALRLTKNGMCRFYTGAIETLSRAHCTDLLNKLMVPDVSARIHRQLQDACSNGQMTADEADEVWTSFIWFARTHNHLRLRIEAGRYRLKLHQAQNLPSAEANDLTELLEAVQPIFQRHEEGRLQLSQLYEQRAECNARACRARAALEDYDRAVRFAQAPAESIPSNDAVLRLADLRLARGRFETRHRLFEQALDDFDRAVLLLEELNKITPQLLDALIERARTLMQLHKDDAALEDLEHLCTLLPPDRGQPGLLRCEACTLQGELYDRKPDPLKAAAAYGRVVEYYRLGAQEDPQLLPALAAAYSARAASYIHNDNLSCAYADYSESIETLTAEDAPDNLPPEPLADAYLQRARLLHRTDRFDEALSDCTAGIMLLEPHVSTSARALTALCLSLYQLRERLHVLTDSATMAAEDRRRMAQLQILLR